MLNIKTGLKYGVFSAVIIANAFCIANAGDAPSKSEVLKIIKKIDGKYNQATELDKYINDVSPIFVEYIGKHPEDHTRCPVLLKKLADYKVESAIPAIMQFFTRNYSSVDVAEDIDFLKPYGEKLVSHMIEFLTVPEVRNSQNDKARLRALQFLQDNPSKMAIPVELSYLEDKSEFVGYAAAIALGNIKDKTVIDKLLDIFHGEHPQLVRIGAAEALGMLGKSDGFEFCQTIAGNKNSGWRCAAIEAIGKIEHPKRMQLVMSALRDNWDMGGKCSVEVLTDIGTKAEIPALEEYLKSISKSDPPWIKTKLEDAVKTINGRETKKIN